MISTISAKRYPFERLEEFAENGESFEVKIEGLERANVKEGGTIWQRFSDFLPFDWTGKNFTMKNINEKK